MAFSRSAFRKASLIVLAGLAVSGALPARSQAAAKVVAGRSDLGAWAKAQPRKLEVERRDSGSITPVSLTEIATDLYLFVNYRNIYLLDAKTRKVSPVPVKIGAKRYNPTSIYYSKVLGQVVVANYTKQDVLIFKLSLSPKREVDLELVERLTHPTGIVGAEGVDLTDDGRFMAVASYEGNSVSLFERVGGRWTYRWTSKALSAAHAVTISGDAVYGGGMNAIAKFDIRDGREIKRISEIASKPIQFATCLGRDGRNGGVFGSDAIAGSVFSLDADLNVMEATGSNGPGPGRLSMPYCAYRTDRETLILSTYQERIIRIRDGRADSLEMRDGDFQYLESSKARPDLVHFDRFDKLAGAAPPVEIMGLKLKPRYGSLKADNGTELILPNRTGMLAATWLFYLVSTAQRDGDVLIAANSAPGMILFEGETGRLGLKLTDDWDCWADGADVFCPKQRTPVKDLWSGADFMTPETTLAGIARSAGKPIATVKAELSSDGGRDLLRQLSDEEPNAKAAKQYLDWAQGKSTPLVEYWIAWSLAGRSLPDTVIAQRARAARPDRAVNPLAGRLISSGDLKPYGVSFAGDYAQTVWNAAQEASASLDGGAWIGMDFGPGKAVAIHEVEVNWVLPAATPKAVKVEASDDGRAWEAVDRFDTNSSSTPGAPYWYQSARINKADIAKRYWRITPTVSLVGRLSVEFIDFRP